METEYTIHNTEEINARMQAQIAFYTMVGEKDLWFKKNHRPSYKKKLRHK